MPFKMLVTARDAAIVVAGGLVALAIMLTNHWTISTQNNIVSAARLNRWTGEIELCAVNPSTLSGSDIRGGKVECSK
jgi:hypothetical protein